MKKRDLELEMADPAFEVETNHKSLLVKFVFKMKMKQRPVYENKNTQMAEK